MSRNFLRLLEQIYARAHSLSLRLDLRHRAPRTLGVLACSSLVLLLALLTVHAAIDVAAPALADGASGGNGASAPICTGTAVNITTSTATATATVVASQIGLLCAEGAPVMAVWGATATLVTGFYLPEGACVLTTSSGTSLAAITRAGGGFLHWTPCS